MKDNLEDAAIGARSMLQFVDCILTSGAADDLESQFEEIIEKFQQKCSTSPSSSSISTLHTVCFY